MRVVHLGRDEKFLPLMISLFDEALPGANRYVIARKRRAKQRHVADAANVVFRSELALRLGLHRTDFADADCLVLHSMTRMAARAVRQVRPDCRVVWIGWGYDYYPLLRSRLGALTLPRTRELLGAVTDEAESTRRSLFGAKQPALVSAAPRIDVCCVVPTELAMLRDALPGLRARQHDLPLFTVEDVFDRGPSQMRGPSVLLGNSATSSNNHVEALDLLRGRLPEGGCIVTPLSYGNAEYGTRVTALGQQMFGERFEALRGWMPIDAYNERIAGCGFVVMNHRRQQAVGNIGAALFKGATVYLRPENSLFPFYRSQGIALRSIDELAQGGGLQPLSETERGANCAAIARYYGRAAVLGSIRRLLD